MADRVPWTWTWPLGGWVAGGPWVAAPTSTAVEFGPGVALFPCSVCFSLQELWEAPADSGPLLFLQSLQESLTAVTSAPGSARR